MNSPHVSAVHYQLDPLQLVRITRFWRGKSAGCTAADSGCAVRAVCTAVPAGELPRGVPLQRPLNIVIVAKQVVQGARHFHSGYS